MESIARAESVAELLELTREPGWADADPDRCRGLLFVADDRSATPTDLERARRWIASQPVPVVAVGDPAASRYAALADVVVNRPDELEAVKAQILRRPVASAVLVQVLRSVQSLPVADALVLESLAYATLQSGAEFATWRSERGHTPRARAPAGDDVVMLDRQGDSLSIVLNSPANRNALSAPLRDGLTEAFQLVLADPSIEAVEVSANGPCFSAGGDLTEFGSQGDPAAAHMIRMLRMPARYLAARAERYRFHVHGACVGAGIELPAFAGELTASPDAFFQLPELDMGLIPGAGGCVSIPRRIGRQRTAWLAFTNRRIDAMTALEWGLVDQVDD